jgi:hypothetical protein
VNDDGTASACAPDARLVVGLARAVSLPLEEDRVPLVQQTLAAQLRVAGGLPLPGRSGVEPAVRFVADWE